MKVENDMRGRGVIMKKRETVHSSGTSVFVCLKIYSGHERGRSGHGRENIHSLLGHMSL